MKCSSGAVKRIIVGDQLRQSSSAIIVPYAAPYAAASPE